MKLTYKLILLCLAIGLIGSVLFLKETVAHPDCQMDILSDKGNKFNALFKNADSGDIKCNVPLGNEASNKYLFHYTIKNQFCYLIIQNTNLNACIPKDVKVADDITVYRASDFRITESNDFFIGETIKVESERCIKPSGKITVNLSKPMAQLDASEKYTKIDLFSKEFCVKNENNDLLYRVLYDEVTPTIVLFCKKNNNVLIIIINKMTHGDVNEGLDYLNL